MATVEATSSAPIRADAVATELVERARKRRGVRFVARENGVAFVFAGVFLVGATLAASFLPTAKSISPLPVLVTLGAYLLVLRVEFEIGNGLSVPTQLVFVPMWFLVPARDVPLVVCAALMLRALPNVVARKEPPEHLAVTVANSMHSLGPAVVLAAAGTVSVSWRSSPIYAAALLAQYCGDGLLGATWSRVAFGVPLREYLRSARWSFVVDAALTPVGLVVAAVAATSIWALPAVLPLVGLFAIFARERQFRIDHALELSHAYRGTALLLGDVIEADDAYTGSHSRDVVDLVLAVADELGLDPRERSRAEFAALLHDVGKVRIPGEIINKPGPLDDDEWAIMKMHTIEGERMLEQIGGLLGEVGRLVRSCHERWDGAGYPDRLGGDEIPLIARIVCCCDAYNAMVTDRSYRKAMTLSEASDELRRCSGTHFDPQVVDALLVVVG